jgi:hypothetical protein
MVLSRHRSLPKYSVRQCAVDGRRRIKVVGERLSITSSDSGAVSGGCLVCACLRVF